MEHFKKRLILQHTTAPTMNYKNSDIDNSVATTINDLSVLKLVPTSTIDIISANNNNHRRIITNTMTTDNINNNNKQQRKRKNCRGQFRHETMKFIKLGTKSDDVVSLPQNVPKQQHQENRNSRHEMFRIKDIMVSRELNQHQIIINNDAKISEKVEQRNNSVPVIVDLSLLSRRKVEDVIHEPTTTIVVGSGSGINRERRKFDIDSLLLNHARAPPPGDDDDQHLSPSCDNHRRYYYHHHHHHHNNNNNNNSSGGFRNDQPPPPPPPLPIRRLSIDTISNSSSSDSFSLNCNNNNNTITPVIVKSPSSDNLLLVDIIRPIPRGKLFYMRDDTNCFIRYFDDAQKKLFLQNMKFNNTTTTNNNSAIITGFSCHLFNNNNDDRGEIIRLPNKVVFSTNDNLTVEEYVVEMTIVERFIPRDFFLFYKFVTGYQICNNNFPISFLTFLNIYNTNGLCILLDKYVKGF